MADRERNFMAERKGERGTHVLLAKMKHMFKLSIRKTLKQNSVLGGEEKRMFAGNNAIYHRE
jgi:hypothetical protein